MEGGAADLHGDLSGVVQQPAKQALRQVETRGFQPPYSRYRQYRTGKDFRGRERFAEVLTHRIEPLERILDSGRTPAEEMLDKFNGEWGGSVEPVYQEYAF